MRESILMKLNIWRNVQLLPTVKELMIFVVSTFKNNGYEQSCLGIGFCTGKYFM